MQAPALDGGFADAAVAAARAFRAALEAMARPGRIGHIGGATPPAPLSRAAGTLILTLCDNDTSVRLAGVHDTEPVRDWVTFHTGAPLGTAAECRFAVGTWDALAPLDAYLIGTAEYPDRSATLIVEMDVLTGAGCRLTGPGIATAEILNLPETEAFRRNAALFPLGLDFLFAAGDRLAGLPRTTKVN